MPRFPTGLIDWDDPASWNREEALAALIALCRTGEAQIPIYDIPTNKRTAMQTRTLDEGERVFIAEGIFASLLIADLRREGLLADAICIARNPLRNMWFRLLRDLGEARKPVHVLLARGVHLAIQEPKSVRTWISHGCRPVASLDEAEACLRRAAASA